MTARGCQWTRSSPNGWEWWRARWDASQTELWREIAGEANGCGSGKDAGGCRQGKLKVGRIRVGEKVVGGKTE